MNNVEKLILAIDTSCDETSVAVTRGHTILSNVVASQVELHRPYGGVFPTVAKLAHQEHIQPAIALALKRAHVSAEKLDAVVVTIGPGLAPALEVGIKAAQAFAKNYNKPLIPANHLEGHICSVLAQPTNKVRTTSELTSFSQKSKHTHILPKLPALAIIVSGGNTLFVKVEKKIGNSTANEVKASCGATNSSIQHAVRQDNQATNEETAINQLKHTVNNPTLERQPHLILDTPAHQTPWQPACTYTVLGRTLDDAAGECLDKVGRMLNLGYPAGPVVEAFAKLGNSARYQFPLPLTQTHSFDLSYSGIKTHARNLLNDLGGIEKLGKQDVFDFCASLQKAIFRHITYKLEKILLKYIWKEEQFQEVWLSGGVAANMALRKSVRVVLRQHAAKHRLQILRLRTPYTKALCGDNAAMLGVATTSCG